MSIALVFTCWVRPCERSYCKTVFPGASLGTILYSQLMSEKLRYPNITDSLVRVDTVASICTSSATSSIPVVGALYILTIHAILWRNLIKHEVARTFSECIVKDPPSF